MKHVLDTDGNGFIDFSTFKEKFGPNMSRLVDVPERELHLPNLCPNKEKLHEYGKRSQSLRTSVNDVRRSFQPEMDASKYKIDSTYLTFFPILKIQNWYLLRDSVRNLITQTLSSSISQALTLQATSLSPNVQAASLPIATSKLKQISRQQTR